MNLPAVWLIATNLVASLLGIIWRRDPESNWARRICNPASKQSTLANPASILGHWARIQCTNRPFCSTFGRILPATFVLTLAACGGGGTTVGVVEVYGDSTALGVDGTHILAPELGGVCRTLACEFVARPWPSYLPGAVNVSVGGLSALDRLSGRPALGVLPWPAQMAASPAHTIWLALSINDAGTSSPAQFRATLVQLVQIARAAGKRVVLVTSPSAGRPDVEALQGVIRSVAADYAAHLVDADAHVRAIFGPALASHIADGIHPDQVVYAAMGAFAARLP